MAMADALAEADPAHAEIYRANAETGAQQIDAAMDVLTAAATRMGDTPFLVQHDSLHYLEDTLGLSALGALSLSDAAPASAAHLARIEEATQQAGRLCYFYEPGPNAAQFDALLAGAELTPVEIDPLGTAIPAGPGFYPALLQEIAAALTTCAQNS